MLLKLIYLREQLGSVLKMHASLQFLMSSYRDYLTIYGLPQGAQAMSIFKLIQYSGWVLLASLSSFDFVLRLVQIDDSLSLEAIVDKLSKIDFKDFQNMLWNQQFIKGMLRVVKHMAKDLKATEAGGVTEQLKAEILKMMTLVLSVWERGMPMLPSFNQYQGPNLAMLAELSHYLRSLMRMPRM